MLWSVILGGNTKKNQVSVQNIFDYNYYLYLCNSKVGLTQDSSIYPSREQYFQVGSIIISSTHIKLIKMEKIIGREAEFGKLTDYMESGKSEFIALYGRRHHIRTQGEYVFRNITSPDYAGRTVWIKEISDRIHFVVRWLTTVKRSALIRSVLATLDDSTPPPYPL